MIFSTMWFLFESSLSIAGIWLTIITVFIAYLYEEYPKFRYQFKFCFYVFYVSCVAIIACPILIFRPRDVRNVAAFAPLVKPVARILGVRWEIKGADILEKDFPCVIVCNHQSCLDFSGMITIWPIMKKCAAIAKKEIIYVIPFGPAAWLGGTVFINRSSTSAATVKLSSTAEEIQKNNIKLWIFPEGTRNKSNGLLPFKKGAFHIAVANKLPIVPVVISPYTFINDKEKIFNDGKVILSILPPIDTSSYSSSDVTKLSELTRSIMTKEYEALSDHLIKTSAKPPINTDTFTAPVTFGDVKQNL